MKRWSLLFVLLFAAPLFAQTAGDVSTRMTIDSKILGEERSLWLRLPPSYGRAAAHYPTLYLTDGDAQMLHTVSTVAFLERQGRIPEMIVVGVNNTDRTRDLTPSAASPGAAALQPTAGGAGNFLAFFEKELIPWVDSKYRTRPFRIFAGHSFGGLFAVNALATRPELLSRGDRGEPVTQLGQGSGDRKDGLAVRRAEVAAGHHPPHGRTRIREPRLERAAVRSARAPEGSEGFQDLDHVSRQ